MSLWKSKFTSFAFVQLQWWNAVIGPSRMVRLGIKGKNGQGIGLLRGTATQYPRNYDSH